MENPNKFIYFQQKKEQRFLVAHFLYVVTLLPNYLLRYPHQLEHQSFQYKR